MSMGYDVVDGPEIEEDKYYQVAFDYDGKEIYSDLQGLKASYLKSAGIFEQDNYYEIIESDQAGNYRVYGVYVPQRRCCRSEYVFRI